MILDRTNAEDAKERGESVFASSRPSAETWNCHRERSEGLAFLGARTKTTGPALPLRMTIHKRFLTLWRRRLRFVLAAAGLFLLASCSRDAEKKAPVVTVEAAPVKQITLERMVTAEAVIYPIDQAEITPKINAPVEKFLVRRGERVHKGQLLAVLENRDLAASEMENKGAYEQARATYENTVHGSLPEDFQKAALEVKATKQAYEAAKSIYEGRKNLFSEGALPRRELDSAEVAYIDAGNQYEIAQKHLDDLQAGGKEEQLKSAKGGLTSAKGKYLGASAQLSYSELHSPIDGWVTDRPAFPGEMASTSKPLITVMDVSRVVARAHVPQEVAALLKVNDAATITAADSAEKVPAKVTIVSPALDPGSTTVEIWVQAANPGNRLRAGSSVHVAITAGSVPNALVVPAAAVLTSTEGKTTAMVIGPDSHAHETEIQIGIRQDGNVQVVSGLKPGQQVVTTGAYGLPDNTEVHIASADPRTQNAPDKSDTLDKDKD
jgi:RND family efflux transporter MFP subunit